MSAMWNARMMAEHLTRNACRPERRTGLENMTRPPPPYVSMHATGTSIRPPAVTSMLREAKEAGVTSLVEDTVKDLRREMSTKELRQQQQNLQNYMHQTKIGEKRTYARMLVGIVTLALAGIAGINGTANASQPLYGGEPLSAWPPVTSSATSTEVSGIDPWIIDDDDNIDVSKWFRNGSPVPTDPRTTVPTVSVGARGFPWIPIPSNDGNDGKTLEATEAMGPIGDPKDPIFKGDRINIVPSLHTREGHTRRAYTVRRRKYFGEYPDGRLASWDDPVLVELWQPGYKGLEDLHRHFFTQDP